MLIEALDKILEETQDFRPRTGFYASDLGKCPRWIAYDFREDIPRPPLTARRIRIFREGKELEENLAEEFQLLSWKYVREVPLRTDFISGRADFFLEDPFPTILEAKTINPYFWQKLARPHLEHVLQLCFYLSCTRLKTGILLYENKGNQERREFQVNPADYQAEFQLAIGRLESLAKMDFYRQLPPRAYPMTDFHCKNCDYTLTCWDGAVSSSKEIEIPQEIEEVVLDYLIAKEDESLTKEKLEHLQEILHGYFNQNGKEKIFTDLGSLIRQKRETVSYNPASRS